MPVTISVTGCSTWMRALTSMKYRLPCLVHQEFDRTGVGVPDRGQRGLRACPKRCRRTSEVERGRGRFLEQLLVPALDAALALAQNLDVAVLVGEHLKLDVAGRADVLFQIDVGSN